MTAQGYVNMSIKPAARRALELLAIDLSKQLGRRVTLSEALERALLTIYVDEIDVTRAPYCERVMVHEPHGACAGITAN